MTALDPAPIRRHFSHSSHLVPNRRLHLEGSEPTSLCFPPTSSRVLAFVCYSAILRPAPPSFTFFVCLEMQSPPQICFVRDYSVPSTGSRVFRGLQRARHSARQEKIAAVQGAKPLKSPSKGPVRGFTGEFSEGRANVRIRTNKRRATRWVLGNRGSTAKSARPRGESGLNSISKLS